MGRDVVKTVRYPELRNMLLAAIGTRKISQQEIAGWCGVSQPAVNDWLNGHDRPRPLYLARLICFLDLGPYATAKAADYDTEQIVYLYESLSIPSLHDVLDRATDDLKKIYQVRVLGSPTRAIEWANGTSDWLWEIAKKVTSSKLRPPLLEILVQILYEQGIATLEIALPNEIWTVTSILEKMEEIAEESNKDENYGLVAALAGEINYTRQQWGTSRLYSSQAIDIVKNPDYQLKLLRTLGVSCAKQGDQKGFKKKKNQVRRLIDERRWLNLEQACETLEGFARVEGQLGLRKAFKTLEESLDYLAEIEQGGLRVPLRTIQLTRTHLEVIQCLEPTDKRLQEAVGIDGLRKAEELGYKRHERQLQKLLKESLN